MTQDELPTSVEELQKLVLALHQEASVIASMREALITAQREVISTRSELVTAQRELIIAKQQAIELTSTVTAQQKQLERSERTIRELLAALKGRKRERLDPNQLLLFEIGELERLIEEAAKEDDSQQTSSTASRRVKKPHGRRIIPDNLPTEEILHELPEEQRLCPVDGTPMPVIRYEVSEQLDYEPSKLKRIVHKRAVYACPGRHDEAALITAPKPPEAIDKCLAAPGLLAAVVVGKFGEATERRRAIARMKSAKAVVEHSGRMEDILSRGGVNLNRSTLYDWMSVVADVVLPIVVLMKQRVRQSHIIQTDDTSVKLIDPLADGGSRTARFGLFAQALTPRACVSDKLEPVQGTERQLESGRGLSALVGVSGRP